MKDLEGEGRGARRAAVLGSGVAGLLAAHVLARGGERVVVFERDADPAAGTEEDAAGPRRGVPQGRHVHALLRAGERALAALVPGVVEELEAAGSRRLDFSAHFRWFHHGAWRVRFDCGEITHFQSRALLESLLRRRLAALGNVEFRYQTSVTGLEIDPGGERVTGLLWRRAEGAGATGQGAEASTRESLDTREAFERVVDASGRGSRLAAWLAEHGFAAPAEERIAVDIAYASRVVRAIPERIGGDALLIYPLAPAETRAGAIFPIEPGPDGKERWLVTLAGYAGDHPPADPAQWLEFARGLGRPELLAAIHDAEPLSEIATFRFPAARWLRYDRLRRLPRGLAALGDGVCSFDPLFGQGMSAAAKAVAVFARHLEGDHGLDRPLALARRVARVIAAPWLLASSEGLRYPQIEGRRPFWMPWLQRYTHQVFLLTSTSPAVYRRILRVLNLLDEPPVFFHPAIVARVIARGLRLHRARPVLDFAEIAAREGG
jgi:2-polyprenyl-6-methoxyphenol hydroxylase-like FAD-dependent oxidoreductase